MATNGSAIPVMLEPKWLIVSAAQSRRNRGSRLSEGLVGIGAVIA
jgi:hypothetical protein